MKNNAIIFPIDFDKSIKCDVNIQDLLYPELEWSSNSTTRTNKHTAIVFLDPSKVIRLIDKNKVRFFDTERMRNVITAIKSTSFWIPPIKFEQLPNDQRFFKLPNGSHRTILMQRSNIDSIPYLTCDRMVENLLDRFGSGKINAAFDLSKINYPIHF